jgi:hypothetical protein
MSSLRETQKEQAKTSTGLPLLVVDSGYSGISLRKRRFPTFSIAGCFTSRAMFASSSTSPSSRTPFCLIKRLASLLLLTNPCFGRLNSFVTLVNGDDLTRQAHFHVARVQLSSSPSAYAHLYLRVQAWLMRLEGAVPWPPAVFGRQAN